MTMEILRHVSLRAPSILKVPLQQRSPSAWPLTCWQVLTGSFRTEGSVLTFSDSLTYPNIQGIQDALQNGVSMCFRSFTMPSSGRTAGNTARSDHQFRGRKPPVPLVAGRTSSPGLVCNTASPWNAAFEHAGSTPRLWSASGLFFKTRSDTKGPGNGSRRPDTIDLLQRSSVPVPLPMVYSRCAAPSFLQRVRTSVLCLSTP